MPLPPSCPLPPLPFPRGLSPGHNGCAFARTDLAPSVPQNAAEAVVEVALSFPGRAVMMAEICALMLASGSPAAARAVAMASELVALSLQRGLLRTLSTVLRFVAAGASRGVVSPAAYFGLLGQLLEGASGRGFAGDSVVYCALLSVLWARSACAELDTEFVQPFLAAASTYVERRKGEWVPGEGGAQLPLQPGEAMQAAGTDGSHLADLAALATSVQELSGGEHPWRHPLLPFAAEGPEGVPRPAEALPLNVPAGGWAMPEAVAEPVTYPYAGFRLLPAEHSDDKVGSLTRYLVRATVMDVLAVFPGLKNFVVSAVSSITIDCACEGVLAEELFSLMLQLPTSPVQPFTFVVLLVELCKTVPSFPKLMSGFVRILYGRLGDLDVELRERLAVWFAYHLNCFAFQWPWERWGWTKLASEEGQDAQKAFMRRTLSKAVLFHFYDGVEKNLPDEIKAFLPERPSVELPEAVNESFINAIVERIRKKDPISEFEALVDSPKGGEEGDNQLYHLLVATLFVGKKSLTHISMAVGRCAPVLQHYGYKPAEKTGLALDAVFALWDQSQEEMVMVVDRMIQEGMLEPSAVLAWALQHPQITAENCTGLWGIAWLVMEMAVAVENKGQTGDFSGQLLAEQVSAAVARLEGAKGGGTGGLDKGAVTQLLIFARHGSALGSLPLSADQLQRIAALASE